MGPWNATYGYSLHETAAGGVGTALLQQIHRHCYRVIAIFVWYVILSWILRDVKRVVPYSIQTLMQLKSALFREDLITLFNLLQQHKIKPLIAQRFLPTEARQAHELPGKVGVTGKLVLVCEEASIKTEPV